MYTFYIFDSKYNRCVPYIFENARLTVILYLKNSRSSGYSCGIPRGNDHRNIGIALLTEDNINIFINQLYLRVKLHSQASLVPRFIFQELLMQGDKVFVHFVEVAYVYIISDASPADSATTSDGSRLFSLFSPLSSHVTTNK